MIEMSRHLADGTWLKCWCGRTDTSIAAEDTVEGQIYEVDGRLCLCLDSDTFRVLQGPDTGSVIDYRGWVYTTETTWKTV